MTNAIEENVNNAFSLTVFSNVINSPYEHIRSDAQHIADIAHGLSVMLRTKVAVTAFGRILLTYDKGEPVQWFRMIDAEIEEVTSSAQRAVTLMFQNAAYPKSRDFAAYASRFQ